MSWCAEKMQHRIVNCKFKCAEYTGICPKKTCSWSAKKKHDQQKMTEYYKNATLSVYNAVFGGYHPV
jgi:hypothetical protein